MFLISKTLPSKIVDAAVVSFIYADHAPMYLVIKTSQKTSNSLKTKEMLCKGLELFFKTNTQSESSPIYIWETANTYFRGITISFTSYLNKIREKERNDGL